MMMLAMIMLAIMTIDDDGDVVIGVKSVGVGSGEYFFGNIHNWQIARVGHFTYDIQS